MANLRTICRFFLVFRLFVFFLALVFSSFSRAQVASETPLEIDIHALGFADLAAARDQTSYAALSTPLVFIDERTLAVSFPSPNKSPGLSTRSDPTGGGFLFHSTFIDSSTGSIIRERSWGNSSAYNALVPFDDGRLLVQLGGLLQLYTKDEDLESFGFQEPWGDLYEKPVTSADRHRLFFWVPKKQGIELTAVEPHTFEKLGTTQLEDAVDFSVSSEFLVFASSIDGKPHLSMRSLTGQKFGLPAPEDKTCYGSVPTLISDKYLLLTGGCQNLTLLPINGDKHSDPIGLPLKSGGLVQVSAAQNRVAFLMYNTRSIDILGETSFTGLQIGVFDVAERKLVFSTSVKDTGNKFAFALSTDGARLAVLTSPKIRIWNLPTAGPTPKATAQNP